MRFLLGAFLCTVWVFIFLSCDIDTTETTKGINTSETTKKNDDKKDYPKTIYDISLGINYGGGLPNYLPTVASDPKKSVSWKGFDSQGVMWTNENTCLEIPSWWGDTYLDCLQFLIVRDVDADGDMDIFLTHEMEENQSGELPKAKTSLFSINNGKGGFTLSQTTIDISENVFTDIADINGDGVPDLIGSSFWGNKGIIRLGARQESSISYGNGINAPASTHGGEAYVIDINKDGLRDIVVGASGSGAPMQVHLYLNNSRSFFTYQRLITNNNNRISYHGNFKPIGDINKDGFIDFAISEDPNDFQRLYLLISTGSLNYNLKDIAGVIVYRTSTHFFQNAAGDSYFAYYKETTNPRTFTSTKKYREYKVNADGTITSVKEYTLGNDCAGSNNAVLADLNSDGMLDMVYYNDGGKSGTGRDLYYCLQNTSGFDTKQTVGTPAVGTFPWKWYMRFSDVISPADFNGDRKLDIAVITISKNVAKPHTYINVFFAQ